MILNILSNLFFQTKKVISNNMKYIAPSSIILLIQYLYVHYTLEKACEIRFTKKYKKNILCNMVDDIYGRSFIVNVSSVWNIFYFLRGSKMIGWHEIDCEMNYDIEYYGLIVPAIGLNYYNIKKISKSCIQPSHYWRLADWLKRK